MHYLRNYKFRVFRQRLIDHFIVYLYCPALKLVMEIDGESHFTEEGQEYDRARTQRLEGYGLKIARFTNQLGFGEYGKRTGSDAGVAPLSSR